MKRYLIVMAILCLLLAGCGAENSQNSSRISQEESSMAKESSSQTDSSGETSSPQEPEEQDNPSASSLDQTQESLPADLPVDPSPSEEVSYTDSQLEAIAEDLKSSEIASCIYGMEITTDHQLLLTVLGEESEAKVTKFLESYPDRAAVGTLLLTPAEEDENPVT